MISPCIGCAREELSKDGCSEACERLIEWQERECPGLRRLLKRRMLVRRLNGKGVLNLHRCECGGRLRIEEGVLYCERCLEVLVRSEETGAGQWVRDVCGKLWGLGWGVHEMARILGVTEKHLRRVLKSCRENEVQTA